MFRSERMMKRLGLTGMFMAMSILLTISLPAQANTFLVINTNDTGDGSLAWAIAQAEANSGPDTVEFAIPTSDPNYNSDKKAWTISITTPLPVMNDGGTFIDGASQAGNVGIDNPNGLEIVIFGKNLGIDLEGFIITSSDNKLYALSIGAFQGFTILFRGTTAHHNAVIGCYLGTDATGMNGYHMKKSEGIRIDQGAHHNIIGGSSDAQRNIISAFYGRAIYIDAGHHNIIKGNYIGVKKNGVNALGNGWKEFDETGNRRDAYEGMLLTSGSYANVIGGPMPGDKNIISANYRAGLRIESTGSDSNVVQGNYIGIGADGETPLPNGEAGIWIARDPGDKNLGEPGPAYNLIGGEVPGAGNVVSGNLSSGIQMRQASHHNRIAGNLIGTNAAATRLIPNSHNGIYFFGNKTEGFPHHNEVGPGNVIIANGEDDDIDPWGAIRMDDEGTCYNWVHRNYLGTNPSGSLVSEYNSGVILGHGANNNLIGPGNTISGNKKCGVWVRHDSTLHNTISQNSIFNNGDWPILTDNGGNMELLPPALLNASGMGVTGSTFPNGLVEIFADDADEAQVYLARVFADGQGNFSWQGTISKQYVTATVTDSAGNTSMLSVSRTVPVELSLFEAKRLPDGNVRLAWRTETETNNYGFYVERKVLENKFTELAYIPGAGTSAAQHDYSFVDKSLRQSHADYRLRQVDFNGQSAYSQIVSLNAQTPNQLSLSRAFPNPFNSETVVSFDLPEAGDILLQVINTKGEVVTTLLKQKMEVGRHSIRWDGVTAQGLAAPSGCYFVRLAMKEQTLVEKVLLIK